MRRVLKICLLASLAAPLPRLGAAVKVRVNNQYGNITARVVTGDEVRVSHSSPVRSSRKDDLTVTQLPGLLAVACRPADGARVDIHFDLTYGSTLEAKTASGAIELTAPWKATRLTITAKIPPGEFSSPKNVEFEQRQSADGWVLRDRLSEQKATYGYMQVQAESPARIVLTDMPLPEDAPVKLHWQAPEILETILRNPSGKARRGSSSSETTSKRGAPVTGRELPVFTSDVRMVNLAVAVNDPAGHPVTGLKPDDFEVVEDGIPQKLAFTGSEEVPFNLALLLDLSGSTRWNREAMKGAARRFIGIARPQDRVAAYALANSLFYVISHLTADRAKLLASIEAIPEVIGETPLYDAIVLSFAEELGRRPGERNALIVISDGLDNQSEVRFRNLRRAAEEINVLIYPVFLDRFDLVPPPQRSISARQNLQQLADASGGRLFRARSAADLAPVYPLVAEELRSVYTVAYYPSNQDFDGSWRSVRVRVKTLNAKVRTRAGYFAR